MLTKTCKQTVFVPASIGFGKKFRGQEGQTLIFLLTAMAMLMILALWLYDMNTCIFTRIRSQNAADAAALSAAQWQARSLNSIGELNLVKAIANLIDLPPPGPELASSISAATTTAEANAAIQTALNNMQARIQFVGPMMAMIAAQQAAKNNGIPDNALFTSALRQHATSVEEDYAQSFTAPNWGSGDWAVSYARMLNYVADQGVAVAADNVDYYLSRLNAGPEAQRWLADRSFYRAIAIRNWCFLEDIVGVYDNFGYWGAITMMPQHTTGNEYFALGVDFTSSDAVVGGSGLTTTQQDTLRGYFDTEFARRNITLHTDWPLFVPPIQWATYDSDRWSSWTKAETYDFSLLASPRAEYDYSGCDAVTAVSSTNSLMLAFADRKEGYDSWLVGNANQVAFRGSVNRLEGFGGSNDLDVRANAAAKPFGQLPGVSDSPHIYKLVLPIFDKVRLIPIALASAFGNSDPTWLTHRVDHLPQYSQSGPDGLPEECFYCRMLKTWEVQTFRQEGIDWLAAVNPETGVKLHPCLQSGPGPGGGSGGVPIAH